MEKLFKRKRKAEADGNQTQLASVCIDLAESHLNNCNYNDAIAEYKTVAMIYKQQNKMLDYACAHRMIGEAYIHLLMYDNALKHEEIYLKVAQKENNKMEEQRAFATMGHIYLTMSLCSVEPNPKDLEMAAHNFIKSLNVCEKLNGVIAKREQMDMMARLFANLGVVKEAQGKFMKGIELVMKSVNICKKYDIFEQLERCYTTLSSLYLKSGDYSNAISNLNLAMETAGRLPQKVSLTCSSLLSKADILMKMNDLQGAKRVLHKAYKLKTTNQNDADTIEKNLRIVMAMNSAEENLLMASLDDHKRRKTLYERLGDGACYFKNYSTAIDYYKMMLHCALKNNEAGKSLSPCYVSLAQTYLDNKEYDKAIEYYNLDLELSKENISESINTTFNITSAMEQAGKDVNAICKLYNNAQEECKKVDARKELARVLDRHIAFLKKHFRLTDAAKLEPQFEELNISPSDSDSDVAEVEDVALGDDVDINNITDFSSSDDEKDLTIKSTRKRNKTSGFTIKRNAKGETQLHVAAIDGKAQLVEKLLGQGHVVNIRDNAGWLPIHEACICGHLEIVKMLVDKGAAINDRGGVKCEGITPLHDAASNGHLEIIEYLLTKGASPLAKTDNGETPLQFLKSWRSGVTLDSEEQTLFNRIIDIMSNALSKVGQHDTSNPLNKSNEALVYVDDDNPIFNMTRSTKRTSRTNSTSSFRSDTPNRSKDSSTYTSDLRRKTNAGDDDLIPERSEATSEYKNTMNALRKTGTEHKKRKSIQQSALLSKDDVDLDDWLEDDMGAMNTTNKKRCRVNLSLRRANSSNSWTSDMDVHSVQSDDCISIDLENIEPNNAITIDTSSDCSTSTKKSVFKKRKSQQTLLKSGFTRVRDSPSPVDSLFSSVSNYGSETSANCRIQAKLSNFLSGDCNSKQRMRETHVPINSTQECDRNLTQNLIKNQMLYIDVRIDEKLFRIPFPAKDLETLTISWLAEETTKRFYKKEAMKPIIEMETKNGAILSDDDVLSVLFPIGVTQCEELRAKVVKLNVPPLKERYLDACQYFNIEPSNEISTILDSATVNLDLSNRKLRETCIPLARALNRQTNLYELNLSGLLAGNKLLEALCESLPTLTSLTVLNLSANHINTDGVYTFLTALQNMQVKSINALDLSYNPLGNESIKHISEITDCLHLQKLNLCGVSFTNGIFEDNRQHVVLCLKQLKELHLGHNKLDLSDLTSFLSYLQGDKIEILDIGNNNVQNGGLGVEIFSMLRRRDDPGQRIALKKAYLSYCKLHDGDIEFLHRGLSECQQLECLDLSFNEFSGTAFKEVLALTPPKRILLMGCENLNENFDIFNNEWKFQSTTYCHYLESTLDYVHHFQQCDTLINMFREIYTDQLDVQGLEEGMLTLSVRNN